MVRDHHKWFSRSLNRDMELLIFGHGGPPVIVFPTSMGAFFEYEDRGMVDALGDKLTHGGLQLYCVASVDQESWYNRHVHPRQRVTRHLQYERYLLDCNLATKEKLEEIAADVLREIDEDCAWAESSPLPEGEKAAYGVFDNNIVPPAFRPEVLEG